MARFPHRTDSSIDVPAADDPQVITDAAPPGDVLPDAPGATPPDASGTAATTGAPTVAATAGQDRRSEVPELRMGRSAASTTYVGVGVGLLVLVVVLIFIIENLNNATVHFLGTSFSLPIGVIILAAAVAGGLLVLIASAVRVLQLRRTARKHRKAEARAQRP